MTPIRSPRYDTMVGKPLTDARIKHYILEGRYGEHARLAQLKADALAKPKTSKPKPISIADLI